MNVMINVLLQGILGFLPPPSKFLGTHLYVFSFIKYYTVHVGLSTFIRTY